MGTIPPRADLEAVLATAELPGRPSRPPDHAGECRALNRLAESLSRSPETVLQDLAAETMRLVRAESAGVSLLTSDGANFTWPAIAGAWASHAGNGLPLDASPCGVVLGTGTWQLFKRPDRRFPLATHPEFPIEEALLTPLIVGARRVGTLWAIHHSTDSRFDAEDLRLLESVGRFAAAAYQLRESIEVQRRQSSALEASERQIRAFADLAPAMLFATNADGRCTFLSRSWYDFTGRDPDTALGFDWLASICPADRADLERRFRDANARHAPFSFDFRLDRIGKPRAWVTGIGRPRIDADGAFQGYIGCVIDVDERKHAECALRDTAAWLAAQKEAFQSAVDGAPLAASLEILTRAATEQMQDGTRCAFYIANKAQTELRHVIGMPEDYARFVEGFRIASDSPARGLSAFTRAFVITQEGASEPRWADWRWLAERYGYRACWSFPVEAPSGRVLGTFAMYHRTPCEMSARDRELATRLTQSAAIIISRHEEAEERARSADALRVADRQKDEFLAMLAHELRNPLAPIRSASELLWRRLDGDADARIAMGMIKRQTDQLARLVDDLLDVSRITEGLVELQRTPIDIAAVVAQAVETVEPRLREKQHKLSVVMSTDDEPIYVEGDFARLVQCVGNILINATKYTPPGGEIRLRTQAERDVAIIETSDNGMGISAEVLPHVFELFVQSERTLDRAQGGLGVGLAVVKRLVEMHGGSIAARSAGLGKGSSFEMRLPRVPRPADAAGKLDAAATQPRRVLIVDDNVDAADSLSALLSIGGHEVEVAYSSYEAVERAAPFCPDVALLDIGLPGMNGYELAQKLRSMPRLRDVRLIAVTGYGQPEDNERTRAAGFDDHLVKPVDLSILEKALTAVQRSDRHSIDRP